MNWENTINNAMNEADTNLTNKISSLCKLSNEIVTSMAPTQIDKENLMKVLLVVKDATLSNERKAEAINQINGSLNLLISLVSKSV